MLPPVPALAYPLPVTGVDACPAGWVAVTLGPLGLVPPPSPVPGGSAGRAVPLGVAVAATLDELPLAGVVGIDMPLGLLADRWRDADRLARERLGRRGVTVFAIPPRPVWQQDTYQDANSECRELTGKGLAAQAWGLRRKLLQADEFRRKTSLPLYEVHPELSFAAMAGAPLPDSKHTAAGRSVRRQLLARVGIIVPARVTGAREDDLLDAAAVAWSAGRIAAGQAVILANPDQRADDGTEIAIRY